MESPLPVIVAPHGSDVTQQELDDSLLALINQRINEQRRVIHELASNLVSTIESTECDLDVLRETEFVQSKLQQAAETLRRRMEARANLTRDGRAASQEVANVG